MLIGVGPRPACRKNWPNPFVFFPFLSFDQQCGTRRSRSPSTSTPVGAETSCVLCLLEAVRVGRCTRTHHRSPVAHFSHFFWKSLKPLLLILFPATAGHRPTPELRAPVVGFREPGGTTLSPGTCFPENVESSMEGRFPGALWRADDVV